MPGFFLPGTKTEDFARDPVDVAAGPSEVWGCPGREHGDNGGTTVDLGDLLDLCEQYEAMGSAVQTQLRRFADNPHDGDCNPNALRMMRDWLELATRYDIDGAEAILEDLQQALDREDAEPGSE